MITYFTYRLNRIAIRLAFGCFILGTFILLLHLAAIIESSAGIGLAFIILAIISNLILFIMVSVHSIINSKNFEEHISTLIILLLNIPIARLYLNFIN